MSKPSKPSIESALLTFIKVIEQTGGVTTFTGGDQDGGPTIDPEWLDLGDAYRDACAALGREPMEMPLDQVGD